MSLQVINAGPLSLLQDYGRYGQRQWGLSTGGPMDEHAFLWANRLLGNAYYASQLEITLGGMVADFKTPTMAALCGADMGATLNGQPLRPWQSFAVRAGDRLHCRYSAEGMRTYLAIDGGFQAPPAFWQCGDGGA